MILIKEDISHKCIGKTSLYISFNYDPKIVEIVKQAEDAIWDNKIKKWELPLNKLAFLINNLTTLDDIELEFLPEDNKEKLSRCVNYKIEPFEHQLEGIDWLINHENGLLLDVP